MAATDVVASEDGIAMDSVVATDDMVTRRTAVLDQDGGIVSEVGTDGEEVVGVVAAFVTEDADVIEGEVAEGEEATAEEVEPEQAEESSAEGDEESAEKDAG